jgi:aminomethyltransferase
MDDDLRTTEGKLRFGFRIRKSPYFEASRRAGCTYYSVYNHMYYPVQYGDSQEMDRRLVEGVTLWDVAVERQVQITGPDASRFVEMLTPRDLSKCAVGQCRYVVLTGADGGILNDPVLLRLAEDCYWLSLADSDILLWAQGLAVGLNYDIDICEPDVSPLQVQGPKSAEVMKALFGNWAVELPYYHLRETDLEGIPVVVARTGYGGEFGYEIYLRDSRYAVRLWDMIMAAGKDYDIGPGASSPRRIEAGIMSYGADITREDNPFHVGLDRLVHLDKEADFIGKKALVRARRNGVDRKLVGVEIDIDPFHDVATERWPVVDEKGARIGEVRSRAFSQRVGKYIGYAMLPIDLTEKGTRVQLAADWTTATATVVPLPFVRSRAK